MPKRILLALCGPLIALAAATGCTNSQISAWLRWHAQDPSAAEAFANRSEIQQQLRQRSAPAQQRTQSTSTSSTRSGDSSGSSGSGSGPCSQWRSTALDAGFSADQWPTVARLMDRESNCQPGAYNPSGASGLMQIMKGWADDCGGSPSDLFSPWFNLHCAVHVYNVQGWNAWSTY